jgi:hypothetical protein
MMRAEEFKLSLSGRYIPQVRDEHGLLVPVSTAPLSEAQCAFLSAPEREAIGVGPRGCGKTEVLVLDYLQGVGRGYGGNWAGIIFRQSHPMLRDLEKLCTDLIRPVWPQAASYNQLKQIWTWKSGETLEFFHFATPQDFDNIQGRQFAFIGFEELVLWETLECYLKSFSCLRSTALQNMPRKIRATANPMGPGHNAVKDRFRLNGVPDGICGPAIVDSIGEDGRHEPARRSIHFSYEDNVLLRRNEPEYMRNIAVSCAGNQARLLAWTKGSWDIVSGGAFDGIFFTHKKFIAAKPFDIPPDWDMFFSYDHGSAAPFSVGFYAVSNGDDLRLADGTVRSTKPGDLFRVGEVYGCVPGKWSIGLKLPINEITRLIIEYKIKRGWRWRDPVSGKWKDRCRKAVADSSIFDALNEFSVATEFEKAVKINGEMHAGINFVKAAKGPGSRKTGFELLTERLLATAIPREGIGLFVVEQDCPAFFATLPVLQRDEKDPDIVGDGQADHVYDECVYALRFDRTPPFRSGHVQFGSSPRLSH